jgi:stage II sporulation protein GA (sporulation sigma-E factor processing peptidase)
MFLVIKMRVYLDIVFIINFIFDFISLLGTSIILKRNTKIIRILLGSILGEITILTIFIRFNILELILLKVVISLLINLVVFSFRDIRCFFTNVYYFYLLELSLGGVLYMFNNHNILFEILIGIIFIYIFIKNIKRLKNNHNKYLSIKLDINNITYKFNAFLDTGNKLKDPYLNSPIILINNKYNFEGNILVPYNTCNYNGILTCIKGNNLYVNNKKINKKFLVGLSNNINLDGVDCIFNEELLEDI